MANRSAVPAFLYWEGSTLTPASPRPMAEVLTLRVFVDRFMQRRAALRKQSTQQYYRTMARLLCDGVPAAPLRRSGGHAGPDPARRDGGLGDVAFQDLTPADVQDLIQLTLQRGYSTTVARGIRRFVQTLYHYAEHAGMPVRAPGRSIDAPAFEPTHELHALTQQQLRALLGRLRQPYRSMVLTAALTGMNVAELCGLRWGRVNLTDAPTTSDGQSLPPHSLLVCEQHTTAGYHSVKTRRRRRVIPLALAVVAALRLLERGAAADEPVFLSRAGTPILAHNALQNVLKPAGRALGMPWLCWHDLRRTFATLTDQAGLSASQRQALLGHASASMTAHYTLAVPEATRAALDSIGAAVAPYTSDAPRGRNPLKTDARSLESADGPDVSELYSPENQQVTPECAK